MLQRGVPGGASLRALTPRHGGLCQPRPCGHRHTAPWTRAHCTPEGGSAGDGNDGAAPPSYRNPLPLDVAKFQAMGFISPEPAPSAAGTAGQRQWQPSAPPPAPYRPVPQGELCDTLVGYAAQQDTDGTSSGGPSGTPLRADADSAAGLFLDGGRAATGQQQQQQQQSASAGSDSAASRGGGAGERQTNGGTSGRPLPAVVLVLRDLVIVAAVCVALLASHAFGIAVQWASAVVGAAAIAGWGYKRGALNRSGAVAAALVGAATLSCSLRLGATLVAFFFSSSKLTKYKEALKSGLDDSAKAGGQRDWVQVACNGLVPSLLAVAYGVLAGCVDVPLGLLPSLEAWRARAITALMGAFLGYYACCCGDTWASELGPLSREPPRLITTGRQVQAGTNGGVTMLGLSASILGGMTMGLIFYVTGFMAPTLWVFEGRQALAMGQWRLIPLGLMAGLAGSVLDSLLGATLQFSGRNTSTGRVTSAPGPGVVPISGIPLLTNNMVNLVSASTTAALTALAASAIFC